MNKIFALLVLAPSLALGYTGPRRAFQGPTSAFGSLAELRGYFVDSVDGDDLSGTNTCKSKVTPCKTIARLLAAAPPAGSEVWLKRGSYWREQLFVASNTASVPGGLLNGTFVRAYGAGPRPIFDGADVIPAGAWTKTAGRTNVYQATVNTAGVYGRAGVGNRIWENWTSQPYWRPSMAYPLGSRVTSGPFQYEAITGGISAAAPALGPSTISADITDGTVHWRFLGGRLLYVADQATCDATPGSWTGPTRPTGGNDVIYVRTSDSTNPASNGKTYEIPMRDWGVNGGQFAADAHLLAEIRGVETWRHGHHDGGVLTATALSDFRVDPGGAGTVDPSHGVWCNGHCEYGEASSAVNYGESLPTVVLNQVSFNCSSPLQGLASRGTAIYFHTGAGGVNKHIKKVYQNVTATNCSVFFSGSSALQVAIINPRAEDGSVSSLASYDYVDRVDIVGARWINATTATVEPGIRSRSTAGQLNVCASRLVANRTNLGLLFGDNGFTGSITARGTSFVYLDSSVTSGSRLAMSVTIATGATITSDHNFFFKVYEPTAAVQVGSSVTSDLNVYSNHATQWRQAGTAYTWTTWRALGKDTNSVQETSVLAGDPLTLNTAPTAASAAWTIGAGADAWGDAHAEECIAAIP